MVNPTKKQLREIVHLEGYYRCYQLLFFQKKHPLGGAEDCYYLDCQDAIEAAFKELVSKKHLDIFFDEFRDTFTLGWRTASRQIEWDDPLEYMDGGAA